MVVRQFARANDEISAGDITALDSTEPEINIEWKREVEARKMHTMAKVHDFLEMWQGSQTLCTTQKESCAQNKQMTAIRYILDTEDIVRASWSNFQHNCAAAFKLSERSPLPPALSAKDLPGGQTQVLDVHRIKRINQHPTESDEHSAPESTSDSKNWLHRNGDLDNTNVSKDNCEEDDETNVEEDNGIEDRECPKHWDVSATSIVPGLIWPTLRSMKKAEKGLMTVTAMETRRRKGNKKKLDRMGQYVFTRFYMLLDQDFDLEKHYGRIVSSRM